MRKNVRDLENSRELLWSCDRYFHWNMSSRGAETGLQKKKKVCSVVTNNFFLVYIYFYSVTSLICSENFRSYLVRRVDSIANIYTTYLSLAIWSTLFEKSESATD
jgi:hypothetical protein